MVRKLTPEQESEFKLIHFAIHENRRMNVISDGNKTFHIEVAPNGCRYVVHDNIKFMEQNKSKSSDYARRAREGEKITWGITNDGSKWILITDKGIEL